MSLFNRIARVALGVPFVWLGFEAAKEPGGRTALVEKAGLPDPEMLVRANGAAMVAGGAALALGIKPRLAATGLIASLIPTTVVGHAFWEQEDPVAAKAQRVQFLKNVALLGGLLSVALSKPATS